MRAACSSKARDCVHTKCLSCVYIQDWSGDCELDDIALRVANAGQVGYKKRFTVKSVRGFVSVILTARGWCRYYLERLVIKDV